MSLKILVNNKDYWPRGVRIITTHISCGLMLVQPVSSWHHCLLSEDFLFRLAFISKHKDKFKRSECKDLPDTVFYSPILPREHFYIDTQHGYVMSSNAVCITSLKEAVTKLDLGKYYDTPYFPNKHYFPNNEDPGLGLMVWYWNGKVPLVKDLSFDCPYNDEGELK